MFGLKSVYQNEIKQKLVQELGIKNPMLTPKLEKDRKSTRLNSSHITRSRMPSSA